MAESVYLLCGLTSTLCACLLYRQYRATRIPLLFWSTLCFAFMALSNILLFVDIILLPNIDLSPIRHGLTLTAAIVILFGLIRERT